MIIWLIVLDRCYYGLSGVLYIMVGDKETKQDFGEKSKSKKKNKQNILWN